MKDNQFKIREKLMNKTLLRVERTGNSEIMAGNLIEKRGNEINIKKIKLMIEKTPEQIIKDLVKKKGLKTVEFAEIMGKTAVNIRNTLTINKMKISTFKEMLEGLDKDMIIIIDKQRIKII